jgi:hypothetical protein
MATNFNSNQGNMMSITGATVAKPCTVLANCAVEMIKRTFADANIQACLPYLINPARVLDSIGPALLILGTAGTNLSSQKQMRAKVKEYDAEEVYLLTDKKITPLPLNYEEKKCADENFTVWRISNALNIAMLVVNLGVGLSLGPIINDAQSNESILLNRIRGFNSSDYCDTPGDDTVFFKLDASMAIKYYGDKVDSNISDSVEILATFKVIAAVTSLFCLFMSVRSENHLGVFKTNKKHIAIVFTMTLAYVAWLALGVYQAMMSNQVAIGTNLNRGWSEECSPLVRD